MIAFLVLPCILAAPTPMLRALRAGAVASTLASSSGFVRVPAWKPVSMAVGSTGRTGSQSTEPHQWLQTISQIVAAKETESAGDALSLTGLNGYVQDHFNIETVQFVREMDELALNEHRQESGLQTKVRLLADSSTPLSATDVQTLLVLVDRLVSLARTREALLGHFVKAIPGVVRNTRDPTAIRQLLDILAEAQALLLKAEQTTDKRLLQFEGLPFEGDLMAKIAN